MNVSANIRDINKICGYLHNEY